MGDASHHSDSEIGSTEDGDTGTRTEVNSRREELRADFLLQTARIAFAELQRYFAAGKLISVVDTLDLIEVAVELAEDNASLFNAWLSAGEVAQVSDAQARDWLNSDPELWAVVADPWVLVQQRTT